jgi:hypothetical protein
VLYFYGKKKFYWFVVILFLFGFVLLVLLYSLMEWLTITDKRSFKQTTMHGAGIPGPDLGHAQRSHHVR